MADDRCARLSREEWAWEAGYAREASGSARSREREDEGHKNELKMHFLRGKLRSLNEATLEGEKTKDGRVGELGGT